MFTRWINRLHVGIDYGTTKSAIATIELEGSPALFKIDPSDGLGRSSISSVVVLERLPYNQYLIESTGWRARDYENIEEKFCRFERSKLDIGMYGFVSNKPENYERFSQITPEDIAAIIIRRLKQAIELRHTPEKKYDKRTKLLRTATVSVPANWNPVQRQATKYAALMAGFDDVALIEEPIAALIHLWNNHRELLGLGKKNERIMIIDMGGGTCDIAVVDVNKSFLFSAQSTKIVHVDGNNFLGGELIEKMIGEKIKSKRPDIGGDDLRGRIEGLKIELNKIMVPQITKHIERFLSNGETWPTNLTDYFPAKFDSSQYLSLSKTNYKMSANDFHKLLAEEERDELINEKQPKRTIINAFEDLITDVKRLCGEKRKIDRVILVGGSSYLYFLRPVLHKFFRGDLIWGSTLFMPDNPEDCVALGAARHEMERKRKRKTFKPKFFYNVNIKVSDDKKIPLIYANRNLPIHYLNARSDPFRVVDPVSKIVIQMKGEGTETPPQLLNITKVLEANETVQPTDLLQAWGAVTVDGILSLRILEKKRRIRFEPLEAYPLDKKSIQQRRKEMLNRLLRFEKDDVIP